MAYNKHEWVAPEGSHLNRFSKANETDQSVDLIQNPALTNTPTPFSAEWMNEMEEGISHAHEAISEIQTAIEGMPENIASKADADDLAELKEQVDGMKDRSSSYSQYGKPPFLVASGKRQLMLFEDIELDVVSLLDTGLLMHGKDYYLFECPPVNDEDDEKVYKVSLSKIAPLGFDEEEVTLIGGFHTLCSNVGSGLTYVEGGETKVHLLAGYMSGDILPYSVWCLNHRPFSEPEGMVYIPSLGFWCDIYLQSGSGANTKSVFEGAITRNRQYVDFVEDQFCVKKALLNDEEFAAAMLGSNEKTAVNGASDSAATNGGAGGRVDTANRRMISIYGVEEGCGSLWQWLATTSAAGGSGWNGQNGGKGDFYGGCFALLAGGYWYDAAHCGSRARNAGNSRSYAYAYIGGRGRSRPQSV